MKIDLNRYYSTYIHELVFSFFKQMSSASFELSKFTENVEPTREPNKVLEMPSFAMEKHSKNEILR